MTPLHVHRDADQTMYVLEGEFRLYLPGKELVAGPGDCVHGPANVPHTEKITSSVPVRLVEVVAPAGFEDFVRAAGEPATELTLPPPSFPEPDLERLARLADEIANVEILGPPGQLP
jgi:hypothetical protein